MRKGALLLAAMGIVLSTVYAGHGAGIQVGTGEEPIVRVERSDNSGLVLTLEFPGFNSEPAQVAGRTFQRLSFPGSGSWGELGGPELPALRKLVLLPDRAGWNWAIVDADYIELSGYLPAPLQEEALETAEGSISAEETFNPALYQQDRWFPADPVTLDDPLIARGFRLGRMELCPLQFNPASGLLRVYRRLTVEITFGGEGANPITFQRAQKSRVFSRLIMSSVLNPPAALDEDGVLGGYLFIVPNDVTYQNTLKTMLVDWKQEKGFPCTVMTLSQAGSTAEAIKATIQNIYNTWPVPPDYLVMVGDHDSPCNMPTFFYTNTSAYNEQCGTDLPFTLLEGTDYFPEMLAGRLSVDSNTELAYVCAKIRAYERDPYMGSTSWFTRGLMVYDSGGSPSCKTTKNRARDLMLAHGFTAVDSVCYPPTSSGGYAINQKINAGVSFVNYRGFGMYTGWTPPNYYSSDISGLSNGSMLPVVTSIVCGGGCFTVGTDPVFGEVWIRSANSVASLRGAVSFVGPSSLHTHTRWNNCIDGGIYQGIFEEGLGNLGSALLRGKMELYYGMPTFLGPGGTTNSVECYFHIYNILGDPGLEMWTGVPQVLSVTHPAALPVGVNSFPVEVTLSGAPVPEVLVCVWDSTTDFQATAWTDENGEALLNLQGAVSESYAVTVTGHDLKPYHGALTISQQAVALGINSYTLNDDMIGESSGDGDGQFNPGETVELSVVLKNTGSSQAATGISGTISSADPYLTITQNVLTGPDAAPGATSSLTDDFNLVLSSQAPHSHIVQISLNAACAQGAWDNVLNLPAVAPLAEIIAYTVMNAGGVLNPGQSANVNFTLTNSGGDPLSNCSGLLSSPDPQLTVSDANGNWGTVLAGASAANTGNPFTLQAAPDCPPGWVIPLQLIVNAGIYTDTITVPFTVGEVSLTDPAGPDAYGYRCFDSRDIQYTQAPVYAWIDASTQPGHVTLNLPDWGYEQDQIVLQSLPFAFTYYGQNYTQVTVCSNGWLSMGNSAWLYQYNNPRNWNIPGALGPSAMIAPFWDDLQWGSGGGAHYWYDTANHQAVFEWKSAVTASGYGANTFEIILLDPAYYPTSTGDGEILFQYYDFNNVDGSENYCTIGLENQEQSDGVKVTYCNLYTPGSAVIVDGIALKFSTDIDYNPSTPDVQVTLTPVGIPIQIPASGGSFDFNISLTNNETQPLNVSVWCDVTMPDGSLYGPVLGPADVVLPAGATLGRDRTQVVPGSAPFGVYHYNAYVGSYPAAVWDYDSFVFAKSSTGYEGWFSGWGNAGEPFPDEKMAAFEGIIPTAFALLSAQPNPFNPETTIRFALPQASSFKLTIFNLQGSLLTTLAEGRREAGIHEITWDASNFPSGIYFCHLQAGEHSDIMKVVLMK